jgi:hypothetical protein
MSDSPWVSVNDRLPEKDVGVLVTDGNVVTAARMCRNRFGVIELDGHCFGGYEWEFYFGDEDVTHWMSLPLPPKG